jgi:hypothetical protein
MQDITIQMPGNEQKEEEEEEEGIFFEDFINVRLRS